MGKAVPVAVRELLGLAVAEGVLVRVSVVAAVGVRVSEILAVFVAVSETLELCDAPTESVALGELLSDGDVELDGGTLDDGELDGVPERDAGNMCASTGTRATP